MIEFLITMISFNLLCGSENDRQTTSKVKRGKFVCGAIPYPYMYSPLVSTIRAFTEQASSVPIHVVAIA